MNVLSSSWNFVKRNKGKLVLFGGAVAGYTMLSRYLGQVERSWEKSASKDFMSEVRKKEVHFENTIQACNSTVLSLAPKILTILDDVLNSQPILDAIKQAKNQDEKLLLWQQLKIQIFTRIISEIYCLCLFVSYLRIQLSVIAGYVYLDSCKSQSGSSNPINQNMQMKYLSMLNAFYQDGINEIIDPVQEAVQDTIGSMSLKEKINLKDVKDIFEKVKTIMSCTFSGPQSPIFKYLIKPNQLDEMLRDQDSQMSAKEVDMIRTMLTETTDILESDDFRRVLESSIEIGYSIILDVLLGCFVKTDVSKKANSEPNGLENGFSNPHSIFVPLGKLLPGFKQSLADRNSPDEKLALVRHLLCLDVLNCFSANVYEAFCEPQASVKCK